MLNTSHFRHQTTGTKIKYIDLVYVIDRRIQDRMDKMTMNRPIRKAPTLNLQQQ